MAAYMKCVEENEFVVSRRLCDNEELWRET